MSKILVEKRCLDRINNSDRTENIVKTIDITESLTRNVTAKANISLHINGLEVFVRGDSIGTGFPNKNLKDVIAVLVSSEPERQRIVSSSSIEFEYLQFHIDASDINKAEKRIRTILEYLRLGIEKLHKYKIPLYISHINFLNLLSPSESGRPGKKQEDGVLQIWINLSSRADFFTNPSKTNLNKQTVKLLSKDLAKNFSPKSTSPSLAYIDTSEIGIPIANNEIPVTPLRDILFRPTSSIPREIFNFIVTPSNTIIPLKSVEALVEIIKNRPKYISMFFHLQEIVDYLLLLQRRAASYGSTKTFIVNYQ